MRSIELKNENYFSVQGFMVNELKLKGNELMTYAIIYGFSQTDGQWFDGTLSYISAWLGVNNKVTPQNCINSLLEKNLLEKDEQVKNGVKFCRYRAIAPNLTVCKNFDGYAKNLYTTKQNKDKSHAKNLNGMQNFCTPMQKNCTPVQNFCTPSDNIKDNIKDNIDVDTQKENIQNNNFIIQDNNNLSNRIALEILKITNDELLSNTAKECMEYFLECRSKRFADVQWTYQQSDVHEMASAMLLRQSIKKDMNVETYYRALICSNVGVDGYKEIIDKYFDIEFTFQNGEPKYSPKHFLNVDTQIKIKSISASSKWVACKLV